MPPAPHQFGGFCFPDFADGTGVFIRDAPAGETDAPRTRFLLLHEQQDQLHYRNDDFKQQLDNCESLNHHVVSSRERNAACQNGSSISLNLTG